jgi:hypothetical protein
VGHSSIQVTVDLYGHLVPGLNKGAVHALAEATTYNLGATEAEVDSMEDSQDVEKFGGPWLRRSLTLQQYEVRQVERLSPSAFPVHPGRDGSRISP